MKGTISVSINVGKLRNLIDDEVRKYANYEIYRRSYMYTPYNTGALANSVKIGSDGIHYLQWYSIWAYNNISPRSGKSYRFKTDIHPNATAFWDEKMLLNEYDAFLEDVKKYILERKT